MKSTEIRGPSQPSRTKGKREHRVPLSGSALELLARAREHSSAGLIFPSRKGGEISSTAFSLMFRKLEVKATLHGMRSAFRTWCAENGVSREVAEASIAHVVKDRTERAYYRTDLFERRRAVMQAWADYLAS